MDQYVIYHIFQIVKYIQLQDYDRYLCLIVFYFHEEMETKLWILYLSSSLECISMALHLLFFLLLNFFITLLKTKKMYKKLYIFDVCALLLFLVLVLLIEKSCLVFFFILYLDQFYIKRNNKRCIQFHVLILDILFKQFFIKF